MISQAKLNKYLDFFLLIPFFELQTYSMFIDNHFKANFFDAVLTLYSLLRLLITFCMFIRITRIRKIRPSYTVLALLIFIPLQSIVSAYNGSLYINYTIGSISFLGLAVFSQIELQNNRDDFIWACKHLFGLLSILGAIQIILMPYGFLNHNNKAFAIYLLGAKNTSFFYYTVFLFFLFCDDLMKYKKIKNSSFIFVILFIVAAKRCDSMNTLMMLLILFVFALIVNHGHRLRRFIKPPIVIAAVSLISIVVLVPASRMLLKPLLDVIGRDTSFTGRDVLWEQAIEDFRMHPFAGNGILTEYRLATGVWQDNAHSHFLDLLSKYGIFVFISFIIIPVAALRTALQKDRRNTKLMALKCAVCFMILFHSVVDHMVLYHFILLMSSIELLSFEKSKITAEKRAVTMRRIGIYG